MDFIRQQWNLIQERLSGLTASQKMLVGALVVITIMTMLYWGKFASGREMIALTTAPMSQEEIATATASLRAKGISFTTSGSTIMVPADSQMDAMSDLTFNQVIPSAPNFFESMFEKTSVWGTQGDYNARLNNARERTLGAMMSAWPDVKSASVMIHDTQQRGIGRYEPRATVNITTRSGTPTKKLSQSAMKTVQGGVSGLSAANIAVTVDGQSFSNPGESVTGAGDEAFDLIRQFEIAMAEKIRSTYVQYCPSIVVSVTADVETQTRKELQEKVDPTNKVVVPIDSTTDSLTTTEAPPSGEPGLVSNGAIDANSTMAQPGSTSEKVTERNQVAFGKSHVEILTPAGKAKCVGAAIRVPRSYFVKCWRVKMRKPDAEPTEAEYAAAMQAEVAAISGEVKRLTNIADETQISVIEFPDDPVAMVPAGTNASSGGVTMLASTYAREAAIGVLALASLFMVSRIVKKSAPAPSLVLAGAGSHSGGSPAVGAPGAGKARGPVALAGGEDIAGEVAEGGQILMGQELDAATLETSQMVDQVSSYVKENPDVAANLIRRMMARD